MNSIKRLLAVMGTIAVLMAVAPVASAGSHGFHLDKTCGPDASEPLGFVCVIQHADFKWFPAGTKVHYTSANPAGDVVQATIEIKNGSTDGECVWSSPVNAVCTFGPGTGRLSQFHLVVDVTADADVIEDVSLWFWDGTYWFGGGS